MIIFTDASYSLQTNASGFGFVILDKRFEFKAGNYSLKCKNNNIAEIGAIAEALKYCEDYNLFKATKDKTLTIISDSKYSVNKIQKKIPADDTLEAKYLEDIHKSLDKCKLKVNIFQIKGHQGDRDKFSYYNELADEIASSYRYLGEMELEKIKFQEKLKDKKWSR